MSYESPHIDDIHIEFSDEYTPPTTDSLSFDFTDAEAVSASAVVVEATSESVAPNSSSAATPSSAVTQPGAETQAIQSSTQSLSSGSIIDATADIMGPQEIYKEDGAAIPVDATTTLTAPTLFGEVALLTSHTEVRGRSTGVGTITQGYRDESTYRYAISSSTDELLKFDEDGVVWSVDVPAENSPDNVTVDTEGNAYVLASPSGSSDGTLVSYDRTGTLRWSVADPYRSDEYAVDIHVDDNDIVYIWVGIDTNLYTFDANTGSSLWTDSNNYGRGGGVASTADGDVYTTTNGEGIADAKLLKRDTDGDEIWDHAFDGGEEISAPLVESDGEHVTLDVDGVLHRVDVTGSFGASIDNIDDGVIEGEILATSIDIDDSFYFAYDTGDGYELLKYDWGSGAEWTKTLGGEPDSMDTSIYETLYINDRDIDDVVVLDTSDGSEVWRATIPSRSTIAAFPDISGNESVLDPLAVGTLQPRATSSSTEFVDIEAYSKMSSVGEAVSSTGGLLNPSLVSEVGADGTKEAAATYLSSPAPTASGVAGSAIVESTYGGISPDVVRRMQAISGLTSSHATTSIGEIWENLIRGSVIPASSTLTQPTATASVETEASLHGRGSDVQEPDVFSTSIGGSVTSSVAIALTDPRTHPGIIATTDDPGVTSHPTLPDLLATTTPIYSTTGSAYATHKPSVSTHSDGTGVLSSATVEPLVVDGGGGVVSMALITTTTGTPLLAMEPHRPIRALGQSRNVVALSGGNQTTISSGNQLEISSTRDADVK
ncbi:PQQ-binding-like beta-propeller repeat protein [Halobacteria archaeon AArc-curdl1]|uniref:PQQ-binding-like beta-propeller repeat protein n=1 Tax=Natronosalvus hydrolyticus TaxID=2979988 RepID=A0AAP2ZBX5_9EURY|nr:PQQ-binding-like beta-propeller repeat protein [Halobacteria archaeon AArc-curdl1]